MKIVNLQSGSPEWHAWRSTGVGASELSIVLGMNPYMTSKALWYIKIGLHSAPDLSNNPLVINGIRYEATARKKSEDWLGGDTILLPICAEDTTYPFIKASFDGLDIGVNAAYYNVPVELKCPSEKVWLDIKQNGVQSKHYQMYFCQVQQQIYVCNAKRGYLNFYFKGKILPFEIQRDDAFIAFAINKLKEFHDCVLTMTPPKDDPKRDRFIPQGEAKVAWKSLAKELKAVLDQKGNQSGNALNARYSELKTKLANLMVTYRSGESDGIRITRVSTGGDVDHQRQLNAILQELTKKEIILDAAVMDSDNFRTAQRQYVRATKTDDLKGSSLHTNKPAPQAINTVIC